MYYENRKKFEKEIKIFEEFEKNRKLLSWEETFEAVFHYKSLLMLSNVQKKKNKTGKNHRSL